MASVKTNCKYGECEKCAITKKRGFCKEHDKVRCIVEGCNSFALSRNRGLCRKHDKKEEEKKMEEIGNNPEEFRESKDNIEKAFRQPYSEWQTPIRFIYDPDGIEKIPEKKKDAKYEYYTLDDVIEFCEDMAEKQEKEMVEMMDSFCRNDDVNPTFRVRLKEIRNNEKILKAHERYESSLRSASNLRLAMALKRIP